MSALGDLRVEVLEALEGVEGAAFDYVPARLTVPARIVLPDSPYVTRGDVFGTYDVHHTITVVMSQGANDTVTKEADDTIAATLAALDEAGLPASEVRGFYAYESNGGQYLAADLALITNITL